MFTLQQLVEYFAQYSEQQIVEALRIMANAGADIDPEGNEFSPDITEELEKIFEAIATATNEQKSLPHSKAITINRVSELSGSSVNPQAIAAMIRIITESSISEATALAQIRNHVVKSVLAQNDVALMQSLAEESKDSVDYLRNLSGDCDRLDKVLVRYGITPRSQLNIDEFLSAMNSADTKSDVAGLIESSAKRSDTDFIDAFLEDMGA